MRVEKIEVGILQTNCYILSLNNDCIVIDPGDEVDKIISKIGNLNVLSIIITHYHFDHIGALNELRKKYNVCVYDINNLDEKEYKIKDFVFDVIYTKGHHDTCITIYFKDDKIMFTGDFIFKESIGRTDLETGSDYEMRKSLDKIKEYPKDVVIYPGHGDFTTLENELLNNIYLKKV